MLEDIVRLNKGIEQGNLGLGNQSQALVLDHNQRIYILFQSRDSALCLFHSLFALKLERFGDDADGQDVHFLCNLSNNRSCTGAGTAAHACCDENHLAALDCCGNLVAAFLCGLLASFRNASCSAASGQAIANDDLLAGFGVLQCLCICVDRDKLYALHTAFNHSVDSVSAAAANTDDLYGHFYAIIIVVEFKIRHHLFCSS